MTIKPDQPWGSAVDPPADLVVARDDVAVTRHLLAARDDPAAPPALVRGGDLSRTLGRTDSTTTPATVQALPLDLVEVRLDDSDAVLTGCAHVVAHRPWWRGGAWRGPVVAVMNAEFIGDWDVAPRGHPNDGRVEVFEVASSLSMRQRLAARRRLRTATHVPHPAITTRSVRTLSLQFDEPLAVRIDGRSVGRARRIELAVVPDAGIVHA